MRKVNYILRKSISNLIHSLAMPEGICKLPRDDQIYPNKPRVRVSVNKPVCSLSIPRSENTGIDPGRQNIYIVKMTTLALGFFCVWLGLVAPVSV